MVFGYAANHDWLKPSPAKGCLYSYDPWESVTVMTILNKEATLKCRCHSS